MKVVAFLRNAWSAEYAGNPWPRDLWLAELHAHRSGLRIAVMTRQCPGVEFHFENTTPEVGTTSGSRLPVDPAHVMRVLEEQSPAIVVAMGRQARSAVSPI